ncbi:MAG: aspartyl protease family protein [Cyclobacteriaceae bacterium]
MSHIVKHFLYLIIFFSSLFTYAQSRIGFHLPYGEKSVEIPIELYSNLIAIPVTINGYLTLKFILDSGAESVILTEKLFGDFLGLDYSRTIDISGPGVEDSLRAYVATNIYMSLPGNVRARGLNMLVLEQDYLQLKKNLGDEIYGIIGYDVFSRFVVEIDYDHQILRLHDPDMYRPRRNFTRIPLDIEFTKPYVETRISQGDEKDSVRLLVDTGASHSILLDVSNTDDIVMPDEVIEVRLGRGLGGEIPGNLGRMDKFELSEFSFSKILTSIPLEGVYMKAIKRGSRHGTMGGDLLRRFKVVLDYQNSSMYLRKGSQFRDPFEFDMSGITLTSEGDHSDTLVVSRVREDTPAYRVGIQKDDIILSINGTFFKNTTLSDVHALFRKRPGKKIRLVLLREGEKKVIKFQLERMI